MDNAVFLVEQGKRILFVLPSALFVVSLTIIPLLLDSVVRRDAAKRLEGIGPRPPAGVR